MKYIVQLQMVSPLFISEFFELNYICLGREKEREEERRREGGREGREEGRGRRGERKCTYFRELAQMVLPPVSLN